MNGQDGRKEGMKEIVKCNIRKKTNFNKYFVQFEFQVEIEIVVI